MAPQSKQDLRGLLGGGERSRSESLPGTTAPGTKHWLFLGFRSQSLLLQEALCNYIVWCLWALGTNVILLISFCYTFPTASHQEKCIWLMLGRHCHSSFPISPASVWAFPGLLTERVLHRAPGLFAGFWPASQWKILPQTLLTGSEWTSPLNGLAAWGGNGSFCEVYCLPDNQRTVSNIYLARRKKNIWGDSVFMSVFKYSIVHSWWKCAFLCGLKKSYPVPRNG